MEKVVILARHFNGANFDSTSDCALARACAEHFSTINVTLALSHGDVNGHRYDFSEWYTHDKYMQDAATAQVQNYDDAAIRTIILTKRRMYGSKTIGQAFQGF